MKIKVLFFSLIAMLLAAGCTAPQSFVKWQGKESYQVTFLGDIHYDAPQYHIKPLDERRAKLHYTQWKGVSQEVLFAASKQSKQDVPFVVQLGDIINGDCDNAERQGAALQDAFGILKKFFPGKKVFAVRGNHEHRGEKDAVLAPERYLAPLLKKELGKDAVMDGLNYAIRYGRDLYIFYDYRNQNSGKFTKEVLSANSDARHVFFLTHLPMFPCSIGNPGWVVPDFKELIPLLAERKAVVINAHTHSMNHIVYKSPFGTVPQITVTSMGREWLLTPPKPVRCNSFDEWKKSVKPSYFSNPKYAWSVENLKFFKKEDFLTYRVGYLAPSGFMKLEVDGDKVIAHIFTDDRGKPYESWIIKGK